MKAVLLVEDIGNIFLNLVGLQQKERKGLLKGHCHSLGEAVLWKPSSTSV
jgi:hypothetical protein